MKILRFDCIGYDFEMIKDSTGTYVYYDDYEKLLEENKELKEELTNLNRELKYSEESCAYPYCGAGER